MEVPDRAGTLADVVLGYDALQDYEADTFYMGGVIGRYANRIGGAKFTLDGKTYSLARNDGENSLHGGERGFNKVMWKAHEQLRKSGHALEFTYPARMARKDIPAIFPRAFATPGPVGTNCTSATPPSPTKAPS